MAEDLLRYDRMVERALRGVVREALSHVADNKALPGEHHFFISFLTDFPGVVVPPYLRKQYPEEMTIVLQYQFSDLSVRDEVLRVTLSFNNKQEKLEIPLDAITTFADPAVSFALQFQSLTFGEDGEEEDDDDDRGSDGPLSAGRQGARRPPPSGSAEVVTLDAFRKKPQE